MSEENLVCGLQASRAYTLYRNLNDCFYLLDLFCSFDQLASLYLICPCALVRLFLLPSPSFDP